MKLKISIPNLLGLSFPLRSMHSLGPLNFASWIMSMLYIWPWVSENFIVSSQGCPAFIIFPTSV